MKKTYPSVNLLLILTIVFFAWLTGNLYFLRNFASLLLAVKQHFLHSAAGEGIEYLSRASQMVSLWDLLKTVFFLYSRYLIPLALISIAFLAQLSGRGKSFPFIKEFRVLLAILAALGLVDLFYILNPVLAHTVQRVTTLNYFTFALIPLFALSLHMLFFRRKKFLYLMSASIILVVVQFSSICGALFSFYTFSANSCVTYNEVSGMNWLFNKKGEAPTADVLNPQMATRFCDLFYGWPEKGKREDLREFFPDHFGYDRGDKFNYRNQYITISGWDEKLYQEVLVYKKNKDKFTRFTSEDFVKFRNDFNVNKIYDSLDIEIYKS